jgi:hypothetical protein
MSRGWYVCKGCFNPASKRLKNNKRGENQNGLRRYILLTTTVYNVTLLVNERFVRPLGLRSGSVIQGTFGMIQGTFGMIQGTFGVIQAAFGVIQGTFGVIQGSFGGEAQEAETRACVRARCVEMLAEMRTTLMEDVNLLTADAGVLSALNPYHTLCYKNSRGGPVSHLHLFEPVQLLL